MQKGVQRVVLDLDETLVSSSDDINSLGNLKLYSTSDNMRLRERVYHITVQDTNGPSIKLWGTLRPYARELIKWMRAAYSEVVIWSAGTEGYVQAICDELFRDIDPPDTVFSRLDCKIINDNYYKPLHPTFTEEELANTLIFDDRYGVTAGNFGNEVLIPAYEPSETLESLNQEDDTLQRLQRWLMMPEVINCDDVRTMSKDFINIVPSRAKSQPRYSNQGRHKSHVTALLAPLSRHR